MSKYKSPLLTYPKSYFRLFDGNLFLDHPSLAQKQLLSHENFEFLFQQEITSDLSIKDNPQYPLNQPFSFDISLPFNPQPSFDPSLCPHTRFAGQKNNLYNGKRKGSKQWEQKNENTQRRQAMTRHSKPERYGW